MNIRHILDLSPAPDNPRNSEGAFLTLRDGRIAFLYSRYRRIEGDSFAGSNDHAFAEIAGIFSSDGGENFSEPRILTTPDKEKGEINHMSVSLLRLGNGDVGLFYLVKYRGLESRLVMRRSSDEMETFGEPVTVVCPDFPGYYVVNNDRVIRLTSGRLLTTAAIYTVPHSKNVLLEPARAAFFASDDDGFTWRRISRPLTIPAAHSQTGLQEPGVMELPGGALYAWFRTDQGRQYESVSVDGGERWFTPQPSPFTSPDSPMLLKRNPDSGITYAVYNPVPLNEYRNPHLPSPRVWTGNRTPLVLSESRDGVHFGKMQVLEDDPLGGFCYPAMHFLGEKEMLLGYCAGGIDPADEHCLVRLRIAKVTL